MDFFIDVENYISEKKIPLSHILLIGIFLLCAFFTVLFGLADGNFFSIIAVISTGIIAASFSREIKKIHEYNHLVTFQRDLATNGFDASLFAFFIFSIQNHN